MTDRLIPFVYLEGPDRVQRRIDELRPVLEWAKEHRDEPIEKLPSVQGWSRIAPPSFVHALIQRIDELTGEKS